MAKKSKKEKLKTENIEHDSVEETASDSDPKDIEHDEVIEHDEIEAVEHDEVKVVDTDKVEESVEGNTKKNTNKKKSSTKAKSKKEAKVEKENKPSAEKVRVKSEEYYIKVKYADEYSIPGADHIKLTATDKTSFKDSKEAYHQIKEEFKDEASEISLIGITKDKEEIVLHSKKIERVDVLSSIKSNLEQIIQLKNDIVDQIGSVQEEIITLKEQKERIEDIIKNTDYSVGSQVDALPNELIRLKRTLTRIENLKNIIENLIPTLECTNSFGQLEGLIENLES